jgi:hypothetical protein
LKSWTLRVSGMMHLRPEVSLCLYRTEIGYEAQGAAIGRRW